jgi:hypothetical protein
MGRFAKPYFGGSIPPVTSNFKYLAHFVANKLLGSG